jgi:hypothetical protein
VLKMNQSVVTSAWYLSCPFCFYVLTFNKSSPVYCSKCGEELSNYNKLLEDKDERKVYHILGDKWEMGTV